MIMDTIAILAINVVMIFLAGCMDRLRGSNYNLLWGKGTESFCYGFLVATQLGLGSSPWTALVFSALWVAGASFGWGEPLGAALWEKKMLQGQFESWQFWIFKKNAWLALGLRGAIWGACVAPLGFFDCRIWWLSGAMALVMPLAAYIGKVARISPMSRWESQEYFRGWIVAAVATAVRMIASGSLLTPLLR